MDMEEQHGLARSFNGKTSFKPRLITALALGILSAALGPSAPRIHGLGAEDFAVQVTARVQNNPPQIQLEWPASGLASGCLVSRKTVGEQRWTRMATLPGNVAAFTDTSVVLGGAYEYEVIQSFADGVDAYGYIYSGIETPFPADRGRVLLIVDNTFAADLAGGLAQLASDLAGDGWTVLRHDFPRTASPTEVKDLIKAEYFAEPARTKAVFLFGRVPVPYSGDLKPDMHQAHLGAWPADGYYGDMEGDWTDRSVASTSAEDPRNHNLPADGKFDQSEFPGRVALQIGRVDLSDLPSFAPATERDLLQRYLEKNHAYRHRLLGVRHRALVRDNFGEIQGDAPAADAWRSFPPLVGAENIARVGFGEFFSTLERESFVWAYGGGGGGHTHADGVGSTADFAARQPQCVFYMLHGSFFGDWDFPDNFLRAALASPGRGLAAAWTGLPHWFLHHMGLGETIGFSAMLVQNNRGLYRNHVNLSAGQVHVALMGDPTLRMSMISPPSDVAAARAPDGNVQVSWSPSSDPVRGYYVYRGANPSGPFDRLNRSFLPGTSYTDESPPDGPKIYMVRAILLETSNSGSYYNPSQGAFAAASDDEPGPELAIVRIEAASPAAREARPAEGAFVITRSGPNSGALMVNFTISGTAGNGVDYQAILETVMVPEGSSSARITIMPIPDLELEGAETVTLTLAPSSSYRIETPGTAMVTIEEDPRILSIVRRPVGQVQIRFTGNIGRPYVVQASKDFQTWSSVASGVFGTGQIDEFVDTTSFDGDCRFYRFEWP